MRQTSGLTHFSPFFDAFFTPFERKEVVLLQPKKLRLQNKLYYTKK